MIKYFKRKLFFPKSINTNVGSGFIVLYLFREPPTYPNYKMEPFKKKLISKKKHYEINTPLTAPSRLNTEYPIFLLGITPKKGLTSRLILILKFLGSTIFLI